VNHGDAQNNMTYFRVYLLFNRENHPFKITTMIMRISFAIVAIIFGGVFLGANFPNNGIADGDNDREKLIIRAVMELLDIRHFQEHDIDDAFSRQVFKTYMRRLDGGKRFITLSAYDLMDDYEESIDDALREPDMEFFELSYELINEAVLKVKKMYPEILSHPFDFSIDENIEMDGENLEYAKDDAELRARWKLYLKYETLTRLANKIDEQETEEDSEGSMKSLAELESEAREDVEKMMDNWFQRLDEVRRSDRFETYLNSVTSTFDPHTGYFNPKRKDDFDITMSQRLEGIGARLQRSGSYTKVTSIVPGGPAWKQGELQVDDLIHAVTQEGEEPVDINGMHIDDVVGMIRGDKGTDVTLTVKKVDGDILDITIHRDEVLLDQGLAQSVLLEFPGKVDKLGYIKLPRFYADFENPDGRSCAEDVASEIEKLKKQNVEGIILDLRNNGGGSLADVVEMSGLFIKDGPIVQVKSRQKDPYVFRDKDDEVRYTGPLIIMVNKYSASASEILAAAMQDYRRAIIVGSTSTFGKGTVQRFYDLDRAIRSYSEFKPLGQLKMTMQKFYRINGGSTQLRGVEPDIVLPDRFSKIEIGEKELEHPMPWSEISKVNYAQDIVDLSSISEIENKSYKRVEANPVFQKIEDNADRVKRIRETSEYSLNLDKYQSAEKARDEETKKYRDMFEEIDGLVVSNLKEDLEFIQLDSSRISRNEAWMESIKKDVYIDESMSIMKDMITAGVAVLDEKQR
jgi:carboxyl-terminal processing protease